MTPSIRFLRKFRIVLTWLFVAMPLLAKDAPWQVIEMPSGGNPSLRFTFNKPKQLSGMTALRAYELDTMAENVSSRLIPSAHFAIYLFDKNKVRIGESTISVSNLGPGETVKFQTTLTASGAPVSLTLEDAAKNPRTVSMTVSSVPQGAVLNVDGNEVGTTPKNITVGVGKHTLTFSKEGFNVGNFPLEISPDDVSGGSVSFELGAASFDSIELRDGSQLVSISGMDVEIRVGGSIQHIDRNRIKRILFVHREALIPNLPAATASGP
jgi:hypothetical protein